MFLGPISQKISSGDFAPPGDHHLGGHLALLLRTHDRGPDNLVTASTRRNPQRINNNLD